MNKARQPLAFREDVRSSILFAAGRVRQHGGGESESRGAGTGELVFRAAIEFRDQEAVVTTVGAPRARTGDDRGLAVRAVDFLIKSHLYKREVPHPLPRNLPDDKQTIALYSFSEYGRWGSFASYDGTTAAKPAEPGA